ncbi:hypothetical protein [Cryobacterium sp. M23]|uniref:hypothetical protein n=1 Tax=Cryobacterium sp. M23 TaxID=2048292 RepID=UPI0011B02194|nr:hypothetical protein [Cryobacterium sp. M23]
MASLQFDPARLRVERAKEHSAEMARVWNRFLEPHPFEFDLRRMSAREYEMRVLLESPIPPALSLLFGEWLYNLRSALDYVVWAAAVHTSRKYPPPGESALQYPIYDDESSWKRNLYRLAPLAEHHREMLLTMQPFNSDPDGNYLGWLNRLARIDRHRTLAVSTARVAEAEPVVGVPRDAEPRFRWGERSLRNGVCRLGRLTFDRDVEPEELHFNPRVGIDPEIDEWSKSPFWSRIRFSERLRMIELFVAVEITIYEFDTTGDSEDLERLTETFRNEVLTRRASQVDSPIERLDNPELQWSDLVFGRESNRGRLLGHDFPSQGSHSVR